MYHSLRFNFFVFGRNMVRTGTAVFVYLAVVLLSLSERAGSWEGEMRKPLALSQPSEAARTYYY